MPILNKYEIGVRHPSGNIFYTGYTLLTTCKNDAIEEYYNLSKDTTDKKDIVVNKLE